MNRTDDDILPDEMDAAADVLERAARRKGNKYEVRPEHLMWSPQSLRDWAARCRVENAAKSKRDKEIAELADFIRERHHYGSDELAAAIFGWLDQRTE